MGPSASRRLLLGLALGTLGVMCAGLLVSKAPIGPSPDRSTGPSVEAPDLLRRAELAAPLRAADVASDDSSTTDDSSASESESMAVAPPTPRPSATLVVRLLDPEGRPIDDIHPLDVHVSVEGTVRGSIPRCGPSEDPPPRESEHRETELPVGPQVAVVSVPGFLPSSIPFLAVSDSETVVVARLDRGICLAGVVVDEKGQPVAGAEVNVHRPDQPFRPKATARSGAEGRFSITGLAPGKWLADASFGEVRESSFTAAKDPLEFDVTTRDAHFVLVHWGWVSLRVVTPEHTAAEPASLFLSSTPEPRFRFLGSSDKRVDGRILIGPFEPGEQHMSLTFESFAPIRCVVETRWSETVDLGEILLDPGVAWGGRVVDLSGAPIDRAEVHVDVDGAATTNADASGRFAFGHLPRQRIDASVSAPTYVRAERSIDLERTSGPQSIVLRHGGLLKGRVTGVSGEHATNDRYIAGERLAGTSEADACPTGESGGIDSEGAFEIRLSPGRWRLSLVDEDNLTTKLGEWTVTEGETKDVGALALPK